VLVLVYKPANIAPPIIIFIIIVIAITLHLCILDAPLYLRLFFKRKNNQFIQVYLYYGKGFYNKIITEV
jgi:hypothetical protein